MKRMSNRAKKELMNKAMYHKAIGNYREAIELVSSVIKSENNLIGYKPKRIKSKSYVSVKQKPEVTASSKLNYNMGDYWYDSLSCVHKRA